MAPFYALIRVIHPATRANWDGVNSAHFPRFVYIIILVCPPSRFLSEYVYTCEYTWIDAREQRERVERGDGQTDGHESGRVNYKREAEKILHLVEKRTRHAREYFAAKLISGVFLRGVELCEKREREIHSFVWKL